LNSKVLQNVVVIFLLCGGLALAHYSISSVSALLIEARTTEARVLRSIVQDNWKGIQSISVEKKKTLVENLDPDLAAEDLKLMKHVSLILAYALFLILIVERVNAITRYYRSQFGR
jgi:hypothetical protein